MIVQYLDYLVYTLVPDFFALLDSFMITGDVTFLGLIVSVALFGIGIGSILMRVS